MNKIDIELPSKSKFFKTYDKKVVKNKHDEFLKKITVELCLNGDFIIRNSTEYKITIYYDSIKGDKSSSCSNFCDSYNMFVIKENFTNVFISNMILERGYKCYVNPQNMRINFDIESDKNDEKEMEKVREDKIQYLLWYKYLFNDDEFENENKVFVLRNKKTDYNKVFKKSWADYDDDDDNDKIVDINNNDSYLNVLKGKETKKEEQKTEKSFDKDDILLDVINIKKNLKNKFKG